MGYLDTDSSEGSLHFYLRDLVVTVHVNDLKSFTNSDIGLFYCFEQSIKSLFFFIMSKHSTSSHLAQKFSICDGLATIEIELVEKQFKLVVSHLKAESSDGGSKLVFAEFSTVVSVKFFEVAHDGDIVMVNEGD